MKRRFEHADGRYWEVDSTNFQCVQLAWGATSKPRQRIDRDFTSRDAAVAWVDGQIATHLAKGYVEAGAREAAPPPPESRQAKFEWTLDGEQHYMDVVLAGSKVHHRTGTIEDGKTHINDTDTQHFPSVAAANARFDELCAEARARQTTEIDLAARAANAIAAAQNTRRVEILRKVEPTFTELEQQCIDSPDAEGPWLVYADFLEANEDPRGRIAALARAGQSVHNEILELLRGIADDVDEDDPPPEERGLADHEIRFEFGLEFGFVRRAHIIPTYDSAIALDIITRRFLANPVARFVDALRFGLSNFEGNNDWAPTLRAIVESEQAAHIRKLEFNAYTYEDSEISWVMFGDFTRLLDASTLPELQHLHIRSGSGGTLGSLDLPSLHTLIRESGGLARSEIAAITKAKLPNLRHLELWTGHSDYGAECTLEDLVPILAARNYPHLRHLGIVNSELVEDLVPALVETPLLAQLHSLDLSRGIGGDALTERLVEHARAFRHLASIDLSQNLLREGQTDRIRAVLDNVVFTDQRTFLEDRYVAVGE